jgi:HAE1 family hydrophobic/amphiphilic exporter-1
VVIGGLISSTALTLVLVPTLYTMVENGKERMRRRRDRRRDGGRTDALVTRSGDIPKQVGASV